MTLEEFDRHYKNRAYAKCAHMIKIKAPLHIGEFINARVNESHSHVFADSRPQTPH